MKKLITNFNLKFLYVLLVALAFSTLAFAEADPGGGDNLGDADAPIDGGLSLLLAAGVAYGAKKGYDKKKKTTSVKEETVEK